MAAFLRRQKFDLPLAQGEDWPAIAQRRGSDGIEVRSNAGNFLARLINLRAPAKALLTFP